MNFYEIQYRNKEGRTVARKGHIAKREVMPDPQYNSVVVSKLINKVMVKKLQLKKSYMAHLI